MDVSDHSDDDADSWSSITERDLNTESVTFTIPLSDVRRTLPPDFPVITDPSHTAVNPDVDIGCPPRSASVAGLSSECPDRCSSAPSSPSRVTGSGTYADRVRRDPSDAASGGRSLPWRRSYLSDFERLHFHSHNVTPDRPCTAFFTLQDKSIPSKTILESLVRDGIPAIAVRCLQRSPSGTVQITFSHERFRDLFVTRSSFMVGHRPVAVHPSHAPLTFVTVYDAPYELPDVALEHRLKKFGSIFSSRHGRLQGFPSVFNGLRHLRMAIHTPIPSYLRFGKFLVRVQYPNQRPTCRRCNGPDHMAKACTQEVCFNCDGVGHMAPECPEDVRCCICKETGHMAIDCWLSWFRRPLSCRDSPDAEASQDDNTKSQVSSAADEDEIDPRVEAAEIPPSSGVESSPSSQGDCALTS